MEPKAHLAVKLVALLLASAPFMAMAEEQFRAEIKGFGGATCAQVLSDNDPSRDTIMMGYIWGSLATASFYEASVGREIRQPRALDIMNEMYQRCEEKPFFIVAEIMNVVLTELGGSLTPAEIDE